MLLTTKTRKRLSIQFTKTALIHLGYFLCDSCTVAFVFILKWNAPEKNFSDRLLTYTLYYFKRIMQDDLGYVRNFEC